MKIILESIKELLSEGRIEDVRKKFPNVSPGLIDFFVNNDPSGNQKYLEWMVKAIDHLPTVHAINGELIGYDPNKHGSAFSKPHIETANEIVNLVRNFHELLPYLVHTDNGKKEGTTDLYRYKFTDGEMIHYLLFDLHQAFARKEKKEKEKREKEVRRQADKIYEDKDWLVVRPKTWESSCAYGAGTRWCTTSKDTSRHFKRETERKLLVYVINKKLDSNNATYKVAWQIPYVKKLDKILSLTGGIDLNKVKFWDAKDISMGDRDPVFTIETYLPSIPQVVTKSIIDYGQKVMDEFYSGIGYSDNPEIQALIEYLDISPDNVDQIEELTWTNYGMKIYEYDGDGYTVSDENGVTQAKSSYAQDFVEMNSISECIEIMGGDWGNYVFITNPEGIADEMADNWISDLSDDEILEEAERFTKKPFILKGMKELLDDYMISSGVESDLEGEEVELDGKIEREEITPSEYSAELDRIHEEGKELTKYLERQLNLIKDKLRRNYSREYEYEMENNPVRWLKDFGWWENDKPIERALKDGIVSIDEESVLSDFEGYISEEYFSSTGYYNTVNIGGDTYYIFPTDI